MPFHQLQGCRYELKYVISEETARRVREFARCYLRHDQYARADMRYAYPIYSVYLDDPSLSMFHAAMNGHKNRHKLRVRYYDPHPQAPVFFEIKRRVNDVVVKERSLIHRKSASELLLGRCPRRDDLVDQDDLDAFWALKRFGELRGALHAVPRINIYYEREAWVKPLDETVRLTIDRQAAISRFAGNFDSPRWAHVRMEGAILELKFDDRFPIWMRELVQCCDLWRMPMSKYATCMLQLPARAPQLCHM